MKTLSKYFDENPNTKIINLSGHNLKDIDDLINHLLKFSNLESVNSEFIYNYYIRST